MLTVMNLLRNLLWLLLLLPLLGLRLCLLLPLLLVWLLLVLLVLLHYRCNGHTASAGLRHLGHLLRCCPVLRGCCRCRCFCLQQLQPPAGCI
jgi:hypothetical protein